MKRGLWKKDKVVAFSRQHLRTSILASTRAKWVVAPIQEKLENEIGLYLSTGCSLRTSKGLH